MVSVKELAFFVSKHATKMKREIKKLNAKYIIYILYINIINNEYRVYETRIVRRKGKMSECGARPRMFYAIPSIVDERMRTTFGKSERTRREVCVKAREREKDTERTGERARERERKQEYVDDFANARPWDRRRCAGAPSSEWTRLSECECFVSIKEERMRDESET